jgi:cytidylate kinase
VGISSPPTLVVAVDGPSGVGKSSTSRGVALALGLRYLDTGAMYRALTWWLMLEKVDIMDKSLIAEKAVVPRIEVSIDPADEWTRLDGQDVSREIRTDEVTARVSAVAAVSEVRTHLIAMQRAIIAAARPGIVAEGRDIGTIVAPSAPVKVFLTADGPTRARRRAAEQGADVDATETDQARRDRLDEAQSAMAGDAVLMDTTGVEKDEVIGAITRLARERTVPRRTGETSN